MRRTASRRSCSFKNAGRAAIAAALACAAIAVSGCGGGAGASAPAGPASAATGQAARSPTPLAIFGGDLVATPSLTASIEPNRAESIMGAAPSESSETIVRFREGDVHGVAVFRRLWLECAKDPAQAIRELSDTWQKAEGGADLVPVEGSDVVSFLYLPKQPERRGPVTDLGAILACAGSSGMMSANLLIEGDIGTGKSFMAELARSLRAGPSRTATAARTVSIAACGRTLEVDTPEPFVVSEDVGADFSVHRFRRIQSLGENMTSFAIYDGDHPKAFAPADAASIALAGDITVRRWEDAGGVHLERAVANEGCTLHAFAVGPPEQEASLRKMMAFQIGARNAR